MLNACSIQHTVNVGACVFNAPNGNKTPSAARDDCWLNKSQQTLSGDALKTVLRGMLLSHFPAAYELSCVHLSDSKKGRGVLH